MKKIFCLLMLAFLATMVMSCKDDSAKEDGKEEQNVEISKESVKILAIGNSFSDNAMSYLYPILKAFGAQEIILGNMYIGGCSLNTHFNNAVNDNPNYIYRKNDSNAQTAGTFVNTSSTKLSTAIVDEQWQFITIQQASNYSGLVGTYNDDQLNYMADYVKTNATNTEVKLGWHMTWAYQQDSTHSAFKDYDKDQTLMYQAISACASQKILPNKNYDFIIPAGTSIQNARTSYIGDKLTQDGYHLNALGEYIIGLTWVLKITNWSIADLQIDLVPAEFKRDIEMIKQSAVDAIEKPYEVTQSKFNEKPSEEEVDLTNYDLVEWQPSLGFWNSQSSINLITVDAIANQFVSSGIRFSKSDLPIGTLIFIEEGYGYRPEGWINETDVLTTTRPSNVTTHMIEVTNEWWGNYVLRAFNVYASPRVDMTNKIAEAREAFKIYIPKK